MTKKEKGKKWDGRSRISNDQYKKNWNDIFGNKNVVRTEASFISRDYSEDQTYENEIVYESNGNRKSNKSSN